MTVSSRLALAMILLVVRDVLRRQRIRLLFRSRGVSGRGVDGDHQRGAGRWFDCDGVRDRALPPESPMVCASHRSASAELRRARISAPSPSTTRAYQALADRERMAQAIVESALDAFVQTDERCVILNWSPHAEDLMGWTRAEAVGRSVEELVFPEAQRPVHRQWVDRFLSEAEGDAAGGRYETPLVHKDGREFFAEVSLTALRRREGLHHQRLRQGHHRETRRGRAIVPGAEDGIGRAIDRRHRPRLQQHAHRDHGHDRDPGRRRQA